MSSGELQLLSPSNYKPKDRVRQRPLLNHERFNNDEKFCLKETAVIVNRLRHMHGFLSSALDQTHIQPSPQFAELLIILRDAELSIRSHLSIAFASYVIRIKMPPSVLSALEQGKRIVPTQYERLQTVVNEIFASDPGFGFSAPGSRSNAAHDSSNVGDSVNDTPISDRASPANQCRSEASTPATSLPQPSAVVPSSPSIPRRLSFLHPTTFSQRSLTPAGTRTTYGPLRFVTSFDLPAAPTMSADPGGSGAPPTPNEQAHIPQFDGADDMEQAIPISIHTKRTTTAETVSLSTLSDMTASSVHKSSSASGKSTPTKVRVEKFVSVKNPVQRKNNAPIRPINGGYGAALDPFGLQQPTYEVGQYSSLGHTSSVAETLSILQSDRSANSLFIPSDTRAVKPTLATTQFSVKKTSVAQVAGSMKRTTVGTQTGNVTSADTSTDVHLRGVPTNATVQERAQPLTKNQQVSFANKSVDSEKSAGRLTTVQNASAVNKSARTSKSDRTQTMPERSPIAANPAHREKAGAITLKALSSKSITAPKSSASTLCDGASASTSTKLVQTSSSKSATRPAVTPRSSENKAGSTPGASLGTTGVASQKRVTTADLKPALESKSSQNNASLASSTSLGQSKKSAFNKEKSYQGNTPPKIASGRKKAPVAPMSSVTTVKSNTVGNQTPSISGLNRATFKNISQSPLSELATSISEPPKKKLKRMVDTRTARQKRKGPRAPFIDGSSSESDIPSSKQDLPNSIPQGSRGSGGATQMLGSGAKDSGLDMVATQASQDHLSRALFSSDTEDPKR